MEEAKKTKEKIKEFFEKKYTYTVLYAIISIVYLITLNIVYKLINPTLIIDNTDILGIVTLIISTVLMEKSYKNSAKNFLSGIELLIISIYLLLMNHVSRIYNYEIQTYLESGMIFTISYYILKMAIIYTKEHREQLNSLSDIKQIIKEEPVKKETKRKNKRKDDKICN